MGGILWLYRQMNTLEQVVLQVAIGIDAAEHLVQDGRLSHTIDTTEDIHMRVKIPYDMLLTAPQGVDFDDSDIVCVFHRPINNKR